MSANFPNSATATIEFGIYSDEVEDFLPRYYPERFNVTTAKKLERTAADCAGQRVSIDELKNSELHVTGQLLAQNLDSLDEIAHTTEAVEVISPVFVTGGIEAIVKSVERGEIARYDNFADDWLIKYTIDLVSTGRDEYESALEVRYGEKIGEDELESEIEANATSMPYVDTETFRDLQDPEQGEYGTVEDAEESYIQANGIIPDVLKQPDALNVEEFKFLRDQGFSNEELDESADLLKGDDALTIEEFVEYKNRMEEIED